MLLVFTLSIFASAVLLFLVQPMVAKFTLPLLGGSPAVWNTCMLFFQAALLIGYLYAHLMPKLVRSPKAQVAVHGGVIALAGITLPIALPGWSATPPASEQPVGWLLALLTAMIGAPFFALSTNGPLMQRWFANTGHKSASDPYFLYAASNLGSMIALLGYPLLIDGKLTRAEQSKAWTIGYVLFVVLAIASGVLMARRAGMLSVARPTTATSSKPEAAVAPLTWSQRIHWTLLAFVPSSLVLGVTQYLSTDVASVPLLWIVPLTLYLLTFIIAFSPRLGWAGKAALWAMPVATVLVVAAMWLGKYDDRWSDFTAQVGLAGLPQTPTIFAVQLAFLFVASLACHGKLAANRPHASHLTEFFLILAIGGVLGGLMNALLAPMIFRTVVEYPIAIVLASFLALPAMLPSRVVPPGPNQRTWFVRALPRLLFASAITGVLVASSLETDRKGEWKSLHVERTFFGVHRVIQSPNAKVHMLVHGATVHGMQIQSLLERTDGPAIDGRSIPTKYFFSTGPIGDIFRPHLAKPAGFRVAVVGLGVGTLAMYGKPGWEYDFYEIDPAVKRIATTPEWFSFMERARGRGVIVNIVMGDGRVTLQRAPDKHYDLIIFDAFSGDSIPMHLVTKEAVQLYLDKLKPDGTIAMNVSNKFVEIRPVISGIAASLGLVAYSREDSVIAENEEKLGKERSTWMAVARRVEDLGDLPRSTVGTGWKMHVAGPTDLLWTDESANFLDVMKWK